jgi:hypothetical protein
MSVARDVVFGLVIVALVAGAIGGAVAAAHQPDGSWHMGWVRRSVALGAGALGALALWMSALVVAAPEM